MLEALHRYAKLIKYKIDLKNRGVCRTVVKANKLELGIRKHITCLISTFVGLFFSPCLKVQLLQHTQPIARVSTVVTDQGLAAVLFLDPYFYTSWTLRIQTPLEYVEVISLEVFVNVACEIWNSASKAGLLTNTSLAFRPFSRPWLDCVACHVYNSCKTGVIFSTSTDWAGRHFINSAEEHKFDSLQDESITLLSGFIHIVCVWQGCGKLFLSLHFYEVINVSFSTHWWSQEFQKTWLDFSTTVVPTPEQAII